MEHIPGGNKATGSQPEVHEILAAADKTFKTALRISSVK